MQITKIITAVNDNPTYIQFLPLTAMIWKHLFGLNLTVGYVTSKSVNDSSIKAMSKHGDIVVFPPIDNIDSGIQAKVSRLYLASSTTQDDDNCMIVDIDMLPLSVEALDVFSQAPGDNLIQWGWDHPAFQPGTPDHGKWPMDRTAGSGKVFREIVNPDGLNYDDLLASWIGYNKHGREAVDLPFDKFSDESLLRALYEEWPRRSTDTYRISRLSIEPTMLSRRLDRGYPHMWNDLPNKLRNGEFIEVHGIRPLHENISYYTDILNHFNIRKEDILL